MKAWPTADYPVRVLPREAEEEPTTARLYRGVFTVTLNHTVDVVFVPDVSAVAPPWDPATLPADLDAVATVEQARLAAALLAPYVVTPNAARAGAEDGFAWPVDAGPGTAGVVFYVTPAEFAAHAAELARLTEVAGRLHSQRRVGELREYGVVAFLERRVVDSGRLAPRHAELLGRAGPGAP
jgi:hypothetical protein